MATGHVAPSPRFLGFDSNGDPLSGGKLYTYSAGTSTPLTTYSDSALTTPNANPVVLDSAGRAIVYLSAASYKFTLNTSADVLVWSQDNVSATNAFDTVTIVDLTITGGLDVGFTGTIIADAIRCGDEFFKMDYNSANPVSTYAQNDYVGYNRASNYWEWVIGSTQEAKLDASGLQITNGLVVGFASAPTDDEIQCGDSFFGLRYISATSTVFRFDSGDGLNYDRSNNILAFKVANVDQFVIGVTGVEIALGLNVGFDGTVTDNRIKLGDDNFYLDLSSATSAQLVFDGADSLIFDRTNNILSFNVGGEAFRVDVNANVAFNSAGGASYGSGQGVIAIRNAGTNPTVNPTGGGVLYSNAGAGTWRGSGGTTTAFGPAGPHCGSCGYDFWRVSASNDTWGASYHECGWCGAQYRKGPSSVLDLLTEEQKAEVIH